MKRIGAQLVIILALLLTTSCVDLRVKRDGQPEGAIPDEYATQAGDAKRPVEWWTSFGNPELNALMDEAMNENLSLRQAWARLEQAHAVARQAGADRFPSLSAETGASATRNEVNGQRMEVEEYFLGLAASYELDLWGRIRSGRKAAVLDAEAARSDVHTAAVTLAASVASTWVSILESRADQALLQQQLQSNRTYLELLELRFRKSMATALDIDQQHQTVAQVESQMPLAEAEEQALRYELAVLLGKAPSQELSVGTGPLPQLPPLPDTGLPAELLSQRPDIQAALARLEAADFRVAAARADRLPALKLSASGAYKAEQIKEVLDNWYLNLAANLVAPLIDGGRRAAEVQRTKAVVKEKLAAYREVVLTAIREVEEALIREKKQQEYIAGLQRQAKFANRALAEVKERYLKGQTDYLRVLTATLSVQGLERNLISAQRDLLVLRVGLYRALGGTWKLEPPQAELPAQEKDANTTTQRL